MVRKNKSNFYQKKKVVKEAVPVSEQKVKKVKPGKITAEISTLMSFGIYVNNPKKAEMLLAEIFKEAKISGESISLVAKRFRNKLKNFKK